MSATNTTTGRILVVDDQPTNLRVVSSLLSRQGHEVITASCGEEALALASEMLPDLMLLDMMMPGMDGFTLLAEIKQRPELLSMPAVFLTAAQDRDMLLRAFDAGAVDYVTKPFMPEELMARVNAHIGLKLTRDRYERVANERQELVQLVAHDLKNPLTSVLFASEVLRNNGIKAERVPRYLQVIHESAQDALGYIKSYLEAQAESAASEEQDVDIPARVPMREVVIWISERYELQLEQRKRQLRINGADCPGTVAIQGQVLRQVAENLMTNALKYAPDSDIDLTARGGAPGYWQLLVEDRGPGIPANRQRELFKPFVRLTEHDPTAGGTSSGLGLSLAKQIIANAGGQLWYEDRNGGGARFIVELPESNGKA